MTSISPTACTSQQVIPNQEIPSKVFKLCKDGFDRPCDVTLVVKDGEFKAHRNVLSEASPFFEKLLSSGMKESKEGVVRLEMFTEFVMRKTLEFIYTGNVQMWNEDDTRDVVVTADYLFLQNLKTLAAQTLLQKLNTSNCISIFRFADQYHCEELVSKAGNFISSNFTNLFAANREDIFKMSSKELTMLISSDDLHVSTEEDVFNIILAWINHDRNMRKKCFPELFRHVRLVFISRDSLCSDIVTNDLVTDTDNECCLGRVKEAIELIDSKSFDSLHDKPRKSVEASAIVAFTEDYCFTSEARLIFYFPKEDRWYEKKPLTCGWYYDVHFCHDKICYIYRDSLREYSYHLYIPLSNTWKSLPSVNERVLVKLFVYNDEVYAVFLLYPRMPVVPEELGACSYNFEKTGGIIIAKHNTESNLWEEILSTEFLVNRDYYCIVTHDNFIYFIGGTEESRYTPGERFLSDVDRYDLHRNQWDKLADIQVARAGRGHGAAANGKIFIAGMVKKPGDHLCEMYNEMTNEWHFIKSFSKKPETIRGLFVIDDKLYVLGIDQSRFHDSGAKMLRHLKVKWYNADSDEWKLKTKVAVPHGENGHEDFTVWGTMKVFQGFFSPFNSRSFDPSEDHPSTSRYGRDKRKCSVM